MVGRQPHEGFGEPLQLHLGLMRHIRLHDIFTIDPLEALCAWDGPHSAKLYIPDEVPFVVSIPTKILYPVGI